MQAENIIFGTMYVIVGLVLMAISLPLKHGKVSMNHVIGVRLRKSFTSEKNWYLMNAYGGNQLFRWSAVIAILGIMTFFIPFEGRELLIALFAFLPLIVLVVPVYLIVRYSKTLSD